MAEALMRAGLLRPGQVTHLIQVHHDECRAPEGQPCTCRAARKAQAARERAPETAR
jgi:hypothetical protein